MHDTALAAAAPYHALRRDRMFHANTRLAFALTGKYLGKKSGPDFDDAAQESLLALWIAADKFDPAFGTKFSTYAGRAIVNALTRWREVRDRLGFHGVSWSNRGVTGGVRPEPVLSIDGHEHPDREGEVTDPEDLAILRAAIDELPERERAVIRGRLAGLTLDQCGVMIGRVKESVRRHESRAVRLLAKKFGRQVDKRKAVPA